MALDPFFDKEIKTDPPLWGFAITPSDSADMPAAIRQITIGTTGGVIAYHNPPGVVRTTGFLPVGTYPMAAHRIMATGTTAVGMTGWV